MKVALVFYFLTSLVVAQRDFFDDDDVLAIDNQVNAIKLEYVQEVKPLDQEIKPIDREVKPIDQEVKPIDQAKQQTEVKQYQADETSLNATSKRAIVTAARKNDALIINQSLQNENKTLETSENVVPVVRTCKYFNLN